MPNRIIKESICTSDTVDSLSWFEEVFFYRLIVNCDDYGRLDGRPAIIKSRLFPLKNVTSAQIESCLNKLASVGMILRYEINSRPYLQISTWDKHQNIRAKKSKCPAPDSNVNTSDCKCMQMYSDVPVIQSNPIQSESISESKYMSGDKSPNPPSVIELTLNDKSLYPIYQNQIDEWTKSYPNVNIMQQLRQMKAWLDANAKKRKTKSGILRFVNAWLAREQDKPSKPQKEQGKSSYDLDEFERHSLHDPIVYKKEDKNGEK